MQCCNTAIPKPHGVVLQIQNATVKSQGIQEFSRNHVFRLVFWIMMSKQESVGPN